MSVRFAPELREAVREAADEAGLSLSEWLSQAAEAKLNADRDAGILAVNRALQSRLPVRTNEMALAQAWRDGKGRQATLARALQDITTDHSPRRDAGGALLAGPGDRVLTSDPADLQALCGAAGNDAVVVDC